MSDLNWHIKVTILHEDDEALLEGHRSSCCGDCGGKRDIPLLKESEVEVQFQDGAGLRNPTDTERKDTGANLVIGSVEEAACAESFKIDRHESEKVFFVISRPAENGAYTIELHRDSLSGPLIRKSKALSRARAAELLVAYENTNGALSVSES